MRASHAEGGKLTIETLNAQLDDHYAAGPSGVGGGQYVMIAVTDPDRMDRGDPKAFDPSSPPRKGR